MASTSVTLEKLQQLRSELEKEPASTPHFATAKYHCVSAAIGAKIGADSEGLRQSLIYALRSLLDHDLEEKSGEMVDRLLKGGKS